VNDAPPRGGIRWLPLLALLPLAWWTLRLGGGSARWCFFDWANLAFHEAGHLFFSPLGNTAHYLGGSLFQVLVPAGLAAYFLVAKRNPLGASVCLWWAGESLVNVSIYMADARDLALPLVGGGDHDWNELFFRWGLLTEPAVRLVSGTVRCLGVLGMISGLAGAVVCSLPESLRPRAFSRLLST
jgi:hypothetical protein